jgi:hypothetical protein
LFGTYLIKRFIDDFDLFFTPNISSIYHMKKQIRLYRVFQRGSKSSDKIRRKITDKSDSIIYKDFCTALSGNIFFFSFLFDPHLSHTRSKRRKELIFGKDSLMSQCIHKRRFSSIGISDNPDCQESLSFSRITVERTSSLIGFELLMDSELFIAKVTFHDFSIGLPLSFRIL